MIRSAGGMSLAQRDRNTVAFTIVALAFLLLLVLDVLPFLDPFFRGVPLRFRLGYLAFSALCGSLFVRLSDASLSRGAMGLRRHRWLVPVLLFVAILALRPRIHWGDADWLIAILQEGVHRPSSRWFAGICLLHYAYAPFTGWLYPKTFLTLFHALLGVAAILTILPTLRLLFPERTSRRQASCYVFASFGTWVLLSGYFEIYTLVHAGTIFHVAAMVHLLKRTRPRHFLLFGFTTSFVGCIYMGAIPLMPLALVPLTYALLSLPRRGSTRLIFLSLAGIGAFAGFYLSAAALARSLILSPVQVYRVIAGIVLRMTRIDMDASATSWYLTVPEMFSLDHLVELVDTWLIYGFFGIVLAAFWAIGRRRSVQDRRWFGFLQDGVFVSLLSLAASYLAFMFVKRFVMGFKDWDLYAYAVYFVNIFCTYWVFRAWDPAERLRSAERALRAAAVTWFVFTFLVMNPLAKSTIFLSEAKRVNAIYNYDLLEPVVETPHLRAIKRQLLKR